MLLKYDGKIVGEITTNRSLTLEECFELLEIDIDEEDLAGDPVWDYELFEMCFEEELTTAEKVARKLGGDGANFEGFDELVAVADTETKDQLTRYIFEDGSAIVASADGWDVEGAEPFSWKSA